MKAKNCEFENRLGCIGRRFLKTIGCFAFLVIAALVMGR